MDSFGFNKTISDDVGVTSKQSDFENLLWQLLFIIQIHALLYVLVL